jgi:putative phosphotransacetylase
MTNDELERLAALIAAEIERSVGNAPAARVPWLPSPVRPEPPTRAADSPPVWSGAGQRLGDLAPVREPSPSSFRTDVAEHTAAVRAAAAGQGAKRPSPAGGAPRSAGDPRSPSANAGRARLPSATRRTRSLPAEIPVAISNRHVHLSPADARTLFGTDVLRQHRPLRQPGQFAAEETVAAVGPGGRIEGIRVVGPARGETQLELALSDASRLGVKPPVASSGRLDQSIGGLTLVGPNGRLDLARGVIVAARHLHLSPSDGARWGVADGDLLDVRCGQGPRALTMHGVLARCGPTHSTELHLDVDEARAAGLSTGDVAHIVAWHPGAAAPRSLITERDVVELVRLGRTIPSGALLTPSARDRARALGLLTE